MISKRTVCRFSMLFVLWISMGAVWAGDSPQPKSSWTFDKDAAGQVPKDWRILETKGTGKKADWKVVADTTAPSGPNVLEVQSHADSGTYNLAVLDTVSAKDADVRVRMKANSGQEDQGGGLVWRFKDENNYYVCRLNPKEGNFRVYKVVEGKRTQLESAMVEAAPGTWYELRAVMIGDSIECYVNGKPLLVAKDDTLKAAGKIGFWTKADASTSFDDLEVHSLPEGEPKNEKRESKPTEAEKTPGK